MASEIRFDVPMARHTAWGVGGAAERAIEPTGIEDLVDHLRGHRAGEEFLWVGLGSNLLVRDGGLAETVVFTARGLGAFDVREDGSVSVETGVPCAKLARHCAARGATGTEFLCGIPGTMGGALAMNAGAYGRDTWSLVRSVRTVDRAGTVRTRGPKDFAIEYRRVVGPPGEWFVGAELELEPGDPAAAQAEIRELLRRRADAQPTGQRSCGSVFKNPPADYAGRLIEAAGLKGTRIGGAVVSERHANFIVNDGSASAADVEALIDAVRTRVRERFAVDLEPEVRIVGRAGDHPGGRGG